MKRISLGILLMFIAFSSNAQSKIGTIDVEYILAQMPETAEVNKGLETYNQELQTELKTSIGEYEAMVQEYQKTVADLTDTVKKQKEDRIIELENDIKGFRQKASVMLQMKRNELNGPLYDRIDVAMKKVINEGGYTQIFHAGANGLAFSRSEDDITERVMKELGIEAKPAPQGAASN